MSTFNSPITYLPEVFDAHASDAWKDLLWQSLDWLRHDQVPRREYYVNTLGHNYSYGKAEFARTYVPQIETDGLAKMRAVIEQLADCKFEVCFLNGYENQSDQLGWHSDNSPEMDDDRPIAIVSFGVEREIWFRETPLPRITRDVVDHPVERLKLGHGSVCLMKPGMQDTHQHRIPKASFMCGERISLTFRGYKEPI